MPVAAGRGAAHHHAMHALLHHLQRINDAIERLARTLGGVGIAFAVVGLSASAVERYTIGTGFDLLFDLPPLLMPWIVCLLMAPIMRDGAHIAVDLLPTLLKGSLRRAVRVAAFLATALCAVIFAWGSGSAMLFFARMNETVELSVPMPLWWFYLAFPVGFALLAMFSTEMLLREIAGAPARPTSN